MKLKRRNNFLFRRFSLSERRLAEEFSRKEGLMTERKTSIEDKISPKGFSLSEKRRIIAICNRYAKAIGSVQFCKSKNSSI